MTLHDPKSLVLQFYQHFDQCQIDQATELLALDFVAHLAGQEKPLNREAFQAFGLSMNQAFRQSQHLFDQVIVQENQVVTCGTFTATHLGEFQGLPATGKSVRFAVIHIDRVKHGKIVEHWGQGDALSLMQQLGVVVLPGPSLLPSLIKARLSQLFNRDSYRKHPQP